MSDVGIVLFAALVTLAFRVVPIVVARRSTADGADEHAPAEATDLSILPLAVLTALIVPGAFKVDSDNLLVGTSAAVTALGLVLLRRSLGVHWLILASVAAALLTHVLTS